MIEFEQALAAANAAHKAEVSRLWLALSCAVLLPDTRRRMMTNPTFHAEVGGFEHIRKLDAIIATVSKAVAPDSLDNINVDDLPRLLEGLV